MHFDAKPALAFSAFLDLSCSIDIEGGSQVGINFGPFGINQPLPAPKVNLYRCPPGGSPPPGTPTPTPVACRSRRPGPALAIEHTGPLGAFLNQTFGYAIRVKNTGDGDREGRRRREHAARRRLVRRQRPRRVAVLARPG